MTRRIRWHEEDYESLIGYIGNFEPWAYQIWKSGADWSLMSQLPGDIGRAKRGSLDDLKAEAERWLSGFVSSLGAAFPGRARNRVRGRAGQGALPCPVRSRLPCPLRPP